MGIQKLHLRPLLPIATCWCLERSSHLMDRTTASWATELGAPTWRSLETSSTLETCVCDEVVRRAALGTPVRRRAPRRQASRRDCERTLGDQDFPSRSPALPGGCVPHRAGPSERGSSHGRCAVGLRSHSPFLTTTRLGSRRAS